MTRAATNKQNKERKKHFHSVNTKQALDPYIDGWGMTRMGQRVAHS